MLSTAYPKASFDQCIKCNACVVNCPVSNVTLEFGGPKHMGPELKRLVENNEYINDSRIDYCTMCGNCDIACPENVHVFTLNAFAKARHIELTGSKFRDLILSNAESVGKLASAFGPITNAAMKTKPIRKIMEGIMDIPAERRFPEYRFKNFKRIYKKKTANTERKIAYFVGCSAMYNNPEVAEAFVKVMEYNGIEVAVPDQKCCGVPMFANGKMKQGLKNAEYNVKSFLEYTRKGYDVVLTCTSCTTALKKEYTHFLKTEEAFELAEHVYDADEYLRMLNETGELNTNFGEVNEKAGYYTPCHMKTQGIGNPAVDVLSLIPGYEISTVPADCCGQCGTYGFKKEKYEVSMALGKSMAEAIEEDDSTYTVTECGMCTNQLLQLTSKKVKHPMTVLAEAYEKAASKEPVKA